MPTVREFIFQVYRLISEHNPTTPLHGDDQKLGIDILNKHLNSYASTGLLLTIAKTETISLTAGTSDVIVGPADYTPTPDITIGRLANLETAWLTLEGVNYPLVNQNRNIYNQAWKYEPLVGLPRFIIVFPETEVVRLRLYPSPDQTYDLSIRGKFQLTDLTSNDDMSSLPSYYYLYLLFATARDVAFFTGRAEAWTPPLADRLEELRLQMEAASEVNLDIAGDADNMLNGAALVKSGV